MREYTVLGRLLLSREALEGEGAGVRGGWQWRGDGVVVQEVARVEAVAEQTEVAREAVLGAV